MENRLEPPQVLTVSPEDLDFDFENPRLMDGDGSVPRKETDMVDWLWKNADVSELVESIAQSGWLPFDDMVVMPNPNALSRKIVLEGNRRLAALKLLSDPALANRLSIRLPPIAPELRPSLASITVKQVSGRDAARAYIGFKHINGPHKWDAYAKAKFATEWLDSRGDINEITRTLGDNHNTVRRLVLGYRVLEQAKDQLAFRTEDAANARGFAFSHLYTALGQSGYQNHLGIETSYYEEHTLFNKRPVPEAKIANLKEVLFWLFGSRSEKVTPLIQSQNPNLGELNKVLQNSAAMLILRKTDDLAQAYEEVESRSDRFTKALVTAYQAADEALKLSSAYDGVDESIKSTSANLLQASETIDGVVASKITKAKAKVEPKTK